jgi:hypothetical protein
MVDSDQGLSRGMGERLCRDEPDHDAPDQARPRRCRDRVHVIQSKFGISERRFDQRHHGLHMGSRGNFGNYAAIGAMDALLPDQPV